MYGIDMFYYYVSDHCLRYIDHIYTPTHIQICITDKLLDPMIGQNYDPTIDSTPNSILV